MKGTWFKLLGLMLGLVLTVQAWGQEVFYVYRTDGSVQVFELAEVDSMFCSRTDLSGREQASYVTQEIWTSDSVYRIPMAEVDSVVFDVNRLQVSGDYKALDGYTYHIDAADTGSGQFTVAFSGEVPEFQAGDVVVLQSDTATFLRRVKDAATAGGYVSLSTEAAYLSDLFTSGSFVLSTEPSPVAMKRSSSGDMVYYPVEISYYDEFGQYRSVRRMPSTQAEFENRVFSEVIDYSGQSLHKTDHTHLYLESCRSDFNLDLVMSFNFNSLKEGWEQYHKGNLALYKAVLRGNVETDFMLRFDAKYEKNEDFDEILLKRNVHKPVAVKFVVGAVPVVLTLNTHLLADGEYSCEGDFSAYAGYASSTTAELGFSWTQSSGLKPYATFHNDFTWHKPTIEGEAHLSEKLSVFPRFNFSLYGLVGPSFDIKPYFRQTLDLSFWDELGSNPKDYYGSEYNMYTGFDGAASVNFLPLIGNDLLAGPVEWNINDALLYTSPYDISFKESSSETVMGGQPVEVTFSVRDYNYLSKRLVTPIFPLSVKFETNCGRVERDFANVDVSTGDVSMTWTPSAVPEGETPYLQATLYDSEGKVLAEDRWETTIPSVRTLEAGSVTEESAVLSGEVSGISGSSSDYRYGFFYGTSSVPSVGGREIRVGSNGDDNYTYSLSGLKDNTTYYYCAYLLVDGHYTYGEVRQFTTKKAATVRTTDASSVTTSTAVLSGIVSGLSGSSSDCSYGFFYGTGQIPSVDGQEVRVGTSHEGSYTCSLSGLTENTTYYFCAYLLIDGQYRYGDVLSFRTNGSLSVQTGGVSEVTANSAVLSGVIDGISGVSGNYRYGFFYSTSPTPYNGGQEYAVSVSENGSFTYPVSGLAENTTYYYCAYLWIDGRFSYGEVYSFTTEKASPVKTLGTVSVKSTSATLSGSVYGVAGSYSECSYGFCYGTSPKPYVDGEEVEAGTYEDGEYTFSLYDLDDMTTYYYCAYLSIDGEYSYGEVLSFTTPKSNTDITPGQYVDLGLSVKWTSCNIGADAPEEYGGYYSWGEVSEKDDYSWGNYTYYDMVQYKWIKIGTNISGTEYDVARRRWGIDWRMPTREEWTELVEKCEWEWITYKGTKGQKVTGPNGNSIFFPAAGHRADDLFVGQGTEGEYWSGTLYEGTSLAIWYNGMAYLGAFSAAGSYMIYYTRYVGRSVRAVLAH